jgi:hypothetical protein
VEEGECPDAWDQTVSERKERGRRSGPPGGVWAGRRDGPAGLSWATGKTWADGIGKEGGELGCWAERKGEKGLGFIFKTFSFLSKPLNTFQTLNSFKTFHDLNSFPKFSNKLKTFKTLHHHI